MTRTDARDLPLAQEASAERRKSDRTDLVVRVDYRTVDELFSEFARNINEGGLFVESEAPHPPGTAVDLQFALPGSEDPLQIRAHASWEWPSSCGAWNRGAAAGPSSSAPVPGWHSW